MFRSEHIPVDNVMTFAVQFAIYSDFCVKVTWKWIKHVSPRSLNIHIYPKCHHFNATLKKPVALANALHKHFSLVAEDIQKKTIFWLLTPNKYWFIFITPSISFPITSATFWHKIICLRRKISETPYLYIFYKFNLCCTQFVQFLEFPDGCT